MSSISGAGPPADLRSLLLDGEVRAVYQPIVELTTGDVVAVEALARGPVGRFHLPVELFTAAKAEGVVEELEWACRAAALQGALLGPVPEGAALFVNVEPSLLGVTVPAGLRALERRAQQRLRVVLELTERHLVRRPADVLATVRAARSAGWGIALDDVGAVPTSLALMPLIRPDVVKLDLALVQGPQTGEVGRVASAVSSYAEESGAAVLAEGIETELHLERAMALGATLGQGWRYGRPGPLADLVDRPSTDVIRLLTEDTVAGQTSPFDEVGRHLSLRVARKSQLIAMSRHLERQALQQQTPPLLLAVFQDAAYFTPATRSRYERYAQTCPLVAAFGVGLPDEPATGVRGAGLDAADPLAREWTVVVLSPHFAGALIARDLGDPRDAGDRHFEFGLTHDRRRVTAAARCLVGRIAGQADLVPNASMTREATTRNIDPDGPVRVVVSGSQGVAAVLGDVSHRRATTRALDDLEHRYAALVESTHDAIVSIDGEGRIVSWNGGARRKFDYAADDAIGRPVTDLMPEALRASHVAGLSRAMQGGVPTIEGQVVEVVALRHDGTEFPVELSLSRWQQQGQSF